jgi:hypothetical protein
MTRKEDPSMVTVTVTTYVPDQLYQVPLAKLQPDPAQPRKYMDLAALDEMTTSVGQVGVIEPVVCRQDTARQYSFGYEYFQHNLPLDPSSLVRWLKRLGPDRVEKLLVKTLETAKRGNLLTKRHVEHVNIDTTVQEKAVAFPTDTSGFER